MFKGLRAVDVFQKLQFMAVDPVCKMNMDEKTAKLTSDYKGKKYYFCAPYCKKAFDTNAGETSGRRAEESGLRMWVQIKFKISWAWLNMPN
jgi:YHS domain-containing protein